jgi:hypothetical protein
MVKVLSPVQATANTQTKKERKKQAKREAKTMLKLEQAQKDMQKAEQKAAKVQAQLEADRTRLRNLEEVLLQIRTPQPQATDQEGADVTPTAHADISTPTHEIISGEQTASDVPAEVATDQATSNNSESPTAAAEEHQEDMPAKQASSKEPRPRRRPQTQAKGSDAETEQ